MTDLTRKKMQHRRWFNLNYETRKLRDSKTEPLTQMIPLYVHSDAGYVS